MLSVFWHGLTKPAGPVWNAQEKKKKKKVQNECDGDGLVA